MNAETMAYLIESGLSAEQLLEVARRMEADKPHSSAAKRQARYRQRKAESVTSDVTGDVTPPPIEDHTPLSVSNETAGEPPNLAKQMFDMGLAMLESQGIPEQRARSIIGKWRQGRSPGDVVAALIDAQALSISNLVEWMPKRLSGKRNSDPPSYLDHLIERKRAAAA